MRDYKCSVCSYVTYDASLICLQADGETELCPAHCGCPDGD